MNYTSEQVRKAMEKQYSDQLKIMEHSLINMSRKAVKNLILEKEKEYLAEKNIAVYYAIVLAQTIYKKRFKREVILKGVYRLPESE